MGLRIWNSSSDPYSSTQLAENLLKVDQHDHTFGKGALITTGALADGSVTQVKLDPGLIFPIPDDAISTPKIQNLAVTTAKLADDSVTSVKILDGTIATADIGNLQVTNSKLAGNILYSKLERVLACRVYTNAHEICAAGGTTLLGYNVVRYDTASMYTPLHQIFAPVTGFYQIGAGNRWAGYSGTTTKLLTYLRVNGVDVIAATSGGGIKDGYATPVDQLLNTVYKLNAGDYVEVLAEHDNLASASRDIVVGPNYSPEFWMTYLGHS